MATIGTLPRITAEQLRDLLLKQAANGTKDIAVIDVRDDDHIGGHILSSTHLPSHTHDHALPTLVRTQKDTPILVFHCALSQVRGPKAALNYIRARERLLGSTIAEGEEGGGGGEKQKVYVLHEGFQGWQAKYGMDKELTENYNAALWQDYDD